MIDGFEEWLAANRFVAPITNETFAIVHKAEPRLVNGVPLCVSVHWGSWPRHSVQAVKALADG